MRGLPEEQVCIAKLRELLTSLGAICLGHQLMQLCGYDDVMIKLTPFIERVTPYPQTFRESIVSPQLYLIVEGVKPSDIVRIVDSIYKLLRECGIALKLVG